MLPTDWVGCAPYEVPSEITQLPTSASRAGPKRSAGSRRSGTRSSAMLKMGSTPTSSASAWSPFAVRIITRSAPSTTLAVVRMPLSSTATPEPTRVRTRLSPAGFFVVRWANTVTTAGRARRAIWSMSVWSAESVPWATPITGSSIEPAKRSTAPVHHLPTRRNEALLEGDRGLLATGRVGAPNRGVGPPLAERHRVEDELHVVAVIEDAIRHRGGT